MPNKEFRRHLKQLVASQRNEEPSLVEKNPPKSEPSKPSAITEKKPPTMESRKLNVRRKAKQLVAIHPDIVLGGVLAKFQARAASAGRLTNRGLHPGWFSSRRA